MTTVGLISVCTVLVRSVVDKTRTKILKVGPRHTIYLEKAFVEDSGFPFKPDEPLIARIERNKIVLEKV